MIETSIRSWCSLHYGFYDFSHLSFNKYKSSIFKVIAAALADCVLREKEFAEAPISEDGHLKIIEFKGTNVTGYDQSHWNAVVLYNYLSFVVNGDSDQLYDIRCDPRNSARKGIVYVAQKVKNHYSSAVKNEASLNIFLEKAINDIHFYCKNLMLYEYLNSLINKTPNLRIEPKPIFLRNVYDVERNKKQFQIQSLDVQYNNEDYYIKCCDIHIDRNCVPHYKIKTAKWNPIEGKLVLDVVLDENFNITRIIE